MVTIHTRRYYRWMDGRTEGWLDERMARRMDEWMARRMNGWMDIEKDEQSALIKTDGKKDEQKDGEWVCVRRTESGGGIAVSERNTLTDSRQPASCRSPE